MDIVSRNRLRELISQSSTPCASIYLPLHPPINEEVYENRIRLKNALASVQDMLISRGMRRPDAIEFLHPATALVEDATFWQDRGKGLALFLSAARFACWRLPRTFEEFVWVAERPYIKPLLPLLLLHEHYHLLAVSENQAKLYYGTPFELQEVEVEGLPANLRQALNLQPPEGLYQVRTVQPAYHTKEGLLFHGQGRGEADHAKLDLEAYFREIDRVLSPYLTKRRVEAPLVFCGVEYLFPIYRDANTYPHLHETPICGNPELMDKGELLRRASEVLRPVWEKPLRDDRQRIESLLDSQRVSASIEEILPASQQGRVDALFVALDQKLWGTYDGVQLVTQISESPEVGEDLLDRAALEAMRTDARVYAVPAAEIPGALLAVALYRY
jgi:hypothetical protein